MPNACLRIALFAVLLVSPGALAGPLDRAEPEAIRVVLNATRSDQPRLRANAIEAMSARPDRAVAIAQAALNDPNPAVRYAALVIIGQQQARELGPLAAQRITRETNPSTKAAAIFAAYRCGQDIDLSPLAAMLTHRNPTARGNAAYLIGEIGEASALPMLRELAGAPMPRASAGEQALVRLQFAEAMLKLNDVEALNYVRSATRARDDEVRILAIQVIGQAKDRAMRGNLHNLIDPMDQPMQVRLAAAEALAKMGQYQGLPLAVATADFDATDVTGLVNYYLKAAREALRQQEAAFKKAQAVNDGDQVLERALIQTRAEIRSLEQLLSDEAARGEIAATLRLQAAITLGAFGKEQADKVLVGLLDDPDPYVRLAAATSILRRTAPGAARVTRVNP